MNEPQLIDITSRRRALLKSNLVDCSPCSSVGVTSQAVAMFEVRHPGHYEDGAETGLCAECLTLEIDKAPKTH